MAQIILDSNNNLIQGDFDNATLNNRTKLQTTTTNATTNVYVVPNGSSTSAGVSVANNSSLTNASKIVMATNGTTDTQIISGVNGSGTYLPLSFYTNNALAMQLTTGGIISAAGGGIKFPATQIPSADANTLDDYEEGTWTPQLTFGGSSSGMVTGVALASYTKVGRIVQVTFDFSYTTKGSATGTANIAGLPFPATGSSTGQGYSLGVMTFESNGATTTIVSPYVLAWEDSTLYLRANNGAGTYYTSLTHSNFGTTSEVYGSCVYRTAA